MTLLSAAKPVSHAPPPQSLTKPSPVIHRPTAVADTIRLTLHWGPRSRPEVLIPIQPVNELQLCVFTC